MTVNPETFGENYTSKIDETYLYELRKDVIVSMKENSENKELLLEWIKLREAQAEGENTSSASIKCSIDIAKLCMDVGLLNEAWDGLDSTRDAANSENDGGELIKEIERLMNEIEGGM